MVKELGKQEEDVWGWGVEGSRNRKKYESLLDFESGLIRTLLNMAQQSVRFRKHHFADDQTDLISPNLEFILFTPFSYDLGWVRQSARPRKIEGLDAGAF